MPVQQLVIHQKNSRTLLDRWLKGFCHGAIGDREISHESCNTNFRTPCSINKLLDADGEDGKKTVNFVDII